MTIELELDIGDLEFAARRCWILPSADVLGSQLGMIGLRDLGFRRTRSGVLLNPHHFKVNESFIYKVIRRDHLTLHFIADGEFRDRVRRAKPSPGNRDDPDLGERTIRNTSCYRPVASW